MRGCGGGEPPQNVAGSSIISTTESEEPESKSLFLFFRESNRSEIQVVSGDKCRSPSFRPLITASMRFLYKTSTPVNPTSLSQAS